MAVSREDRERQILDAAVRVFAAKGFNQCRVADIADEAGVAYGLVYHYFGSKDQVLDRVFTDRWNILLEAIAEVEQRDVTAREKLQAIAGFIVDSYRHDPDVMKVIIVEVTRAANTFGATHYPTLKAAFDGIGRIVEAAQREGEFRDTVSPRFAAMAFYGAIEQVLTTWILGGAGGGESVSEEEYERAKWLVVETICTGLEAVGVRAG